MWIINCRAWRNFNKIKNKNNNNYYISKCESAELLHKLLISKPDIIKEKVIESSLNPR
jgi:hypothetical protein